MNNTVGEDKKKIIISATWEYLLKTGLSNATIGDLCREAKLAQSSLYYWFENKDDIWINAGKYGLSIVLDRLFDYTLSHVDNPKLFFDTFLDEIDKYKAEIRCVVQITISSQYGQRMHEAMKSFNHIYADFGKKLVIVLKCTYKQAELFIYSVLSAIVDYVVWEERDKTKMLLDNLYDRIVQKLGA